jgi:adenylate kinase
VRGALYDGFPRTRGQAEALERALDQRGEEVTAVIQIEVPRDTLVARLAGRRICANCGAVFHLEFNPPRQPDVCDRCGGLLMQREDDTPTAVQKRLDLYFTLTAPLLAYYRERGLVATVNGDQAIDAVTDAMVAAIECRADTA